MTAVKAPPPTRLDKARGALDKATAHADALRERHLEHGGVTADELSTATHALELARLAVQGAERDEARAAQQARLRSIGRIRHEIEMSADPAAAVEAFEKIAAGVADLIAVAGPERGKRISRWLNELKALAVLETAPGEAGSADDGHMGWASAGMTGPPRVIVSGRVVAPLQLQQLIDGAVAVGCRRAGHPPALAGVSGIAPNLLADPASWIARNY